MSNDIVERLRLGWPNTLEITDEAADEIERLRADTAVALREATCLLESFVAQHFPTNADWKPQPDLLGVIFQLSNAVVITRDYKDKMGHYKAEIERLRVENWQLKGALGYPVPGHIMDNSDFKCGLCEAKTLDIIEATAEIEALRARLRADAPFNAVEDYKQFRRDNPDTVTVDE